MCDLGIIGGGPAGYTAAEHAAKLGLTVYLFERNEVGGVCLNEGCIPTKTLLYSAKLYDHALHAAKYGVAAEGVAADYGKMATRKNKVVRKLVAGVRARLNHRNITLVKGDACIAGRDDKDIAVECGGTRYLMRNLLVCTGPPFDEKNDKYLASRVKEFQGRKILCGGTTATIISRELGRKMEVDMNIVDKELPPLSRMEGIDLVTEGILTLGKVERILTSGETEFHREAGPAEQVVRMLLDSDKITLLVGTRINIAHQDPNLPVELEIRRNVVKKIKYLLETKYLKDVEIMYI